MVSSARHVCLKHPPSQGCGSSCNRFFNSSAVTDTSYSGTPTATRCLLAQVSRSPTLDWSGGTMFEDSLVESTGRIRTRSKYFAIGSFAVQALLLAALAIYPFLHPATLPKQALTMLLTAPPIPPSPPNLPQRSSLAAAHPQVIMIDNPL